jgi:hypothetical protein
MDFLWNIFDAPETTQARIESEEQPVYADFDNESRQCVVA